MTEKRLRDHFYDYRAGTGNEDTLQPVGTVCLKTGEILYVRNPPVQTPQWLRLYARVYLEMADLSEIRKGEGVDPLN